MCPGNYFNIRIWRKNISGGTEERPIESMGDLIFYCSVC